MVRYSFLDPESLQRAYFDPIRPDEICWKPRDIRAAIEALSSSGKTIGSLSLYFRKGNEVYCPLWGDCLLLPGGNTAYLQLLDGLYLDQHVTLDLIYALVVRFALVLPADYDWTADEVGFKQSVANEIAAYDLGALYFCLQLI
ncbi:hypothetical protein [Pontibacter indicus]|uniref:Uncharacterized protein n=1 Tax=Pontibacter indicus TaxID=1317125 RepID=A0A1R3WCM1_9BACT|nr:hypothetical protein [Pontibacter indicus]SIT74097.1 hypothetical protein SAMN05444128_0068 [Pontibacter indicus]